MTYDEPRAPNNFVYHKGDVIDAALSGEYDVFAHGCNCLNTMGAGVALQVKNRTPEMYIADQNYEISSEDRLGLYSGVLINNGSTYGVNLYTQYHYDRTSKRNFNYGSIISAISRVIYELEHFTGVYKPFVKVCLPRIGAGLARGDWEIIEEMLTYHEFHCKVEFHVYDFDPQF